MSRVHSKLLKLKVMANIPNTPNLQRLEFSAMNSTCHIAAARLPKFCTKIILNKKFKKKKIKIIIIILPKFTFKKR